jgi:hypothetical protein
MTIPDDVRDVIMEALSVLLGRQDFEGEPSERTVNAMNWLEAQPEAPQPDWATAPPWVNWWAADANGETHWFVSAPKVFDSIWMPHPHLEIIDDDGDVDLPVGIDWRTTLRRRPEAQP